MKNMISLNNGRTWVDADEAMEEINARNMWGAVVAVMNDETREAVHNDIAPCTESEFLAEYLRRAEDGLVVG